MNCPNCNTETTKKHFTCPHCGHELTDAGNLLEALTYWDEGGDAKKTAISSTIILGGVIGASLIHNMIPLATGLLLAGLYHLRKSATD